MKQETVEEFLERGGKVNILRPAVNDERFVIHNSRKSNFGWQNTARLIMRQNASGFSIKKKEK